MPITNQSKPTQNTPETKLNIGSAFNLIVGGAYTLIIGGGSSGFTNLYKGFKTRWDIWLLSWDENNVNTWDELSGQLQSNVDKVSIGETWATVATTWGTETGSWQSVSSLFTNVKVNTDPLWSSRTFTWELTSPWTQV